MSEKVESERPAWSHKISEDDARWLLAASVSKISHHREMTGVDTSRDWITLHTASDKRDFDSNFLNTNGYFEFKPNWRELVQATYRGEQAHKDIEAIDAWEKKNRRDRSEYERLKRKFEAPGENLNRT